MFKSKYGNAQAIPRTENTVPHASTYLDFIKSRRGMAQANQNERKPLFLTADEKMMRIQDIIWQIADSNVPVLVTGEQGTGKDVISKAIHKATGGEDAPFIVVNCATNVSALEADLFGVEKGSFPGAMESKAGKLEEAKGGTLILEDVTALNPSAQARVLKLLQEKKFERIGGTSSIPVETRIIATSSKDIVEAMKKGEFRQDLYYRLYVIHIEIPPLRERPKDVQQLAHHFMTDFSEEAGKAGMMFSPDAIEKLLSREWKGNVQELENVVRRTVLLCNDSTVTSKHISFEGTPTQQTQEWVSALPIGQTLRTVETQFILETLKSHDGNRTHAAKTLGISLRTLRNKINEFTSAGYEVAAPQAGRRIS